MKPTSESEYKDKVVGTDIVCDHDSNWTRNIMDGNIVCFDCCKVLDEWYVNSLETMRKKLTRFIKEKNLQGEFHTFLKATLEE